MSPRDRRSLVRPALAVAALVLLVLAAAAPPASAAVRREGEWPDAERAVSLKASGVPRAEALRRLAEAAGWSVILHAPPGDPVDLTVVDQPAGKVLEQLLADGEYVARREGALVTITRAATAPSPPAAPGLESAPGKGEGDPGKDRVVFGESARVEKDEVVHDVSIFGGSLEVHGRVTGDVSVMGGSMHLFPGAHVRGDVSTFGGSVTLDEGSRVDGDLDAVGGSVRRAEGAQVLGKLRDVKERRRDRERAGTPAARAFGWARDAGASLARTALLFLLGAVLLALAWGRMESLTVEAAARPLRSLALGAAGLVAAVALTIALSITLIGIPVAILFLLALAASMVAGASAVLVAVGHALLRHRTQNPYVHLALGCALFLLVGAVPYLGALIRFVVVLTGLGALLATRGAGLFPPRRRGVEQGPYRTAASEG